jgi:hypothetical protein
MSATATNSKRPDSLWAFIETLVQAEVQSDTHDDPPWFETGKVAKIDEKTYWYFLELLPPRWMDGNWFAFGEGTGPFRLFWQVKDAYFVRELTDSETRTFCQLSGTTLHM